MRRFTRLVIDIKYLCLKCGKCCHEDIQTEGFKRIPIYPEEVDQLIHVAEKEGLVFNVIEDLVFPDIKNKEILVITYKINLNNIEKKCPFYNPDEGCIIHNIKPLACRSYPLALKQIDAFNFQISIDPLCRFVLNNYEALKSIDLNQLEKIFEEEFPKAREFFRKNKKLQLKIKKLEHQKDIIIPREITLKDFNIYLKQWDRREIIVK